VPETDAGAGLDADGWVCGWAGRHARNNIVIAMKIDTDEKLACMAGSLAFHSSDKDLSLGTPVLKGHGFSRTAKWVNGILGFSP
jgi:hypothetical protein